MLNWILTLLNPLNTIADKITEYQKVKLNSISEIERVHAEERIATLRTRERVLLAEQSSRLTRWIRPAFALPFVIYNIKIVVWDKVLGLGTTDNLSHEFWQLQMIVFGAYFLTRPFEKRQ